MKKILYILLVLISIIYICGCNDSNDSEDSYMGIVYEDVKITYDGSVHSITASNIPEGIETLYIGNGVSEVGIYTIRLMLFDEAGNFLKELSATLEIVDSAVQLPLV